MIDNDYRKQIIEMVEQIDNLKHLVSIYSFVKVKHEKAPAPTKATGDKQN